MKTNTAPRLPSPLGRQRPLHALLLSLLAIPALLHSSAQAQSVVNGIPSYINYRGRVLNSAGVVVGEITPVNRKVTFKVWAHATSIATGDLIYAEEQTVAILHGDFSALVGQGTRVGGSETTLATSFNASERYLGVTVDDGTPTVDTEITPRQQIASSAFAFRSKFSETANNVVQTTGSSTFTNATISGGSFTGDGSGLFSLNAANITSGTLATARLPGISDALISGMSASKLIGQVSDSQISSISSFKIGGQIANSQIQSLDAAKLTNTGALPQPSSIGGLEIRSSQPYLDFTSDGTSADYNCRLIASAGSRLDYHAGLHVFNGNVELLNALHSYNGIAIDGGISAGQQINANGGISTTSITTSGTITSADHLHSNGGISTNAFTQTTADYDFSINTASVTGGRMVVKTNGRVGIGTPNPVCPLEIVGSELITMNATTGGGMDLFYNGGDDDVENAYYNAWSIKASKGIAAEFFLSMSDRRIKRDIRPSATPQDLASIIQLRVSDYQMVDVLELGRGWRKGLIAQEVEKVIPGAVSHTIGFVPDIFSVPTKVLFDAETKTLSLSLAKDHGLKVGERIRLHVDGTRKEFNVSAVPSPHDFVVDQCEKAPDKVFVYGREVKDFRSVDYDRVFITAVGALQELKKEKDAQVKVLQDENTALRERVAALEAADKMRDAKLAAIEKLLLSADKPAIRTASLKAE